MELWNELLSTALLGVERKAPSLGQVSGGALDGVLAGVDVQDRESALLKAAGAATVYRQAGFTPIIAQQQPLPHCPDEKRASCSTNSAAHISRMLKGEHTPALQEWLDLAGMQRKRVPEPLLPALLDKGASDANLRRYILDVVGERGMWLAAQNPLWAYALASGANSPDQSRHLWHTGKLEARLEVLRLARESHPSLALELIQSTWTQEDANSRAQMLDAFKIGLGMGDEAFLESCLDDRAQEVRRTAARLLSLLPQSRYSQRMGERAAGLLRFVSGGFFAKLVGSGSMDAIIPELGKPLIKDGIDPKLARAIPGLPAGEKGQILFLIMEAVPPSFWTATLQRSPAQLIAAALNEKTVYSKEIIAGWRMSAARFENTEWALELLAQKDEMPLEVRQELLSALPTEQQENFLLAMVKSISSHADWHNLHQIMRNMRRHGRRTWGVNLGRAILTQMGKIAPYDWQMRDYLAYCLPVELAQECNAIPPEERKDAYGGNKFWDTISAALSFRSDMLRALRESDK